MERISPAKFNRVKTGILFAQGGGFPAIGERVVL